MDPEVSARMYVCVRECVCVCVGGGVRIVPSDIVPSILCDQRNRPKSLLL